MSKRFIEIKGIGIPNKGAELMLLAVQEHIGALFPEHHFCCEPTTDFLPRARYGLFQRTGFTFRNRYIEWSALARCIPGRVRDRYGLVTEDQVDVIVDASGFAYGDQWGARKAHTRLGKRIRTWKKQGKKVIMLPQAFGPFKDPALRQEMKLILEHVDLVFARDKQSLAYLDDLLPGKAILSPDFTNLVAAPPVPDQYLKYRGRPCLIPNHKMITMIRENEGYVTDMAACLKTMHDAGAEPFILIHEGEGDIRLGQDIARQLPFSVDVVIPDDALLIKAIIGQCSFVVSSRFHGLVSALSQGVPVIATGWSHKYQELLSDYGVEDYLEGNSGNGSEGAILDLTKRMLNLNNRDGVKRKLKIELVKEKEKVAQFWGAVRVAVEVGGKVNNAL